MADATCSVPGCEKRVIARTYCSAHWRRWRTTGDVRAAIPLQAHRPAGSTTVRDEQNRKYCPTCSRWLTEDNFSRARNTLDGRNSMCRRCSRDNARLNQHGMTRVIYTAMIERQGGRCAICKRPDNYHFASWHVDHDHACCPGQSSCGTCVRGLLCAHCNAALGLLRDDPDVLRAAIDYLEAHL